jgi:hypothetical protein
MIDHDNEIMMVDMSQFLKVLSKPAAAAIALALVSAPAAMAASKPVTQNGVTTQTAAASEAFPGYQKFLSLPAADRSQVNVYYVLRIKHCDASKVSATLTAGGRQIPLSIARDGRITPLPTLAQMNGGAQVTTRKPAECTVGMKIRVFSTQANSKTYDAAALATGIKQGNAAMGRIAGPLALMLPKLDRVYFAGGGNGEAEFANGQKKPLPKTTSAGEYPAGTPYFVPSQMNGATRLHFSNTVGLAHYDTPPK